MTNTEKKDVLPIIVGQFLIVALKGDVQTLVDFREGYVRHCKALFGEDGRFNLSAETVAAGRWFIGIMATRYGWNQAATDMLSGKVEDVCRAWISGGDASGPIGQLRIVDLWSGVASCTTERASVPLSLLDYVVMTILPVVCASEIRTTAAALAEITENGSDALQAVDSALDGCVKRLCCGIALPPQLACELKLVALLHMPKDEGTFSANAGLAYKFLQRQYANAEVK